MDNLFDAIFLIFHWRLMLPVVISIVLALILSALFVGFTAGYCITLVLFAIAFGLILQARSESGFGLTKPKPETAISYPIAFMGFVVIGFFWGGLGDYFLGSTLMVVSFFIGVVALIGAWYHSVLKRFVSMSYLCFVLFSLIVGYFGLLLLKMSNS